jgi:hypothetical protein
MVYQWKNHINKYVKPFKIRKYPKLSKSPSSNIIFKLYSPIWPYVPCLKPALNDGCHPSTNIDTQNHYFLEECTFSIFFKPQVMAGSWYFWGQIHNSTIIIHESMMWDVFPHDPWFSTPPLVKAQETLVDVGDKMLPKTTMSWNKSSGMNFWGMGSLWF